MTDISRSYATAVPPLATRLDEVTIPDGETWRLQKMFGSAGAIGGSFAEILFDNAIIFVTYMSFERVVSIDLVGDGVKKLVIKFKNQLGLGAVSLDMHAGYEGTIL